MKKQTAVEQIQEQIQIEIKTIQIDVNNEVEWSMSVVKSRFEKLLKYSESIKEMEKQQIIDAYLEHIKDIKDICSTDISISDFAENYYNKKFK